MIHELFEENVMKFLFFDILGRKKYTHNENRGQ